MLIEKLVSDDDFLKAEKGVSLDYAGGLIVTGKVGINYQDFTFSVNRNGHGPPGEYTHVNTQDRQIEIGHIRAKSPEEERVRIILALLSIQNTYAR